MAKLVYMAGPLFSDAERAFLELMIDSLAKASGLDAVADFFLPHRDGGELGKGPKRKDIFKLDIQQVDSASIVVALLDGQDVDSGTCIELGYAFRKGKKIFGLLTDFRAYHTADSEPHRPNLMVWGICEEGNTLFGNLNSLAKAFAKHLKECQLKE
ncbi:MAG: nucleoside 2-deoxyribosyltransferase [Deltaproteobacteria bacterium]|nr:nucleoside 2-deoxyribosyltransferase [Deltaproteobacteria bacterium]